MSIGGSMAKSIQLLLVDDEPDLREILKDEFEAEGYIVTEANSGKQALEHLKSQTFDIVVSDIRMPELSGVELLDTLRARDPKIPPVVLITGFADITTDEAYDKGAYAIFAKPFNISEIITSVKRALSPEAQRFERRHERLPVQQEIAFNIDSLHTLKGGRVLNIGHGGLFVGTKGPMPSPGDLISFKFTFHAEGKLIEGTGRCKWVRETSDSNLPEGFGIEFIEISTDTLNIVIQHLARNPTHAHIPRS